ncbi:MAG: energy transducer TonB [Arenimonas sp.]
MKTNQNNRISRRIGALGLCVALSLALTACSEKSGEQADGAAGAAKTQKQKAQTSIERLVQFPEKDLRDGARQAVMEQRWYKPSGNNALEYYLALRLKLKAPDDSVETALVDILPYAVIGMDQAIANFDDREALRLESLIRMADPNAPALARVKADLEKMKARQAQAAAEASAEEEAKTAQEAKALADAKAREEAARRARETAAPVAAAPVSAPATAAQTPAPAVQAPAPQAQAPAAVASAPPPAATRAAVTPISTPQPPYPREALASGVTGEVVAEISINAAGDVTGVRIISASPRNVFDKTVTSTVRRWKYRGNGENTTIRRTFAFN